GLLGQLARSLAGALARSGEATGPQFVTLACSHGCAWLPVKRKARIYMKCCAFNTVQPHSHRMEGRLIFMGRVVFSSAAYMRLHHPRPATPSLRSMKRVNTPSPGV